MDNEQLAKSINSLYNMIVVEQYDPEDNWCILPKEEIRMINYYVNKIPIMKLSIGEVCYKCRLKPTDIRVNYIRKMISNKLRLFN